ncbi:MAG: CPXCG motif-containing cysteine-rich protein [Bacteriovoracaceae bacterium]|nr:CPXCG motif-containing cysteine-rich protein [Bacteriovoracaceae bacterium]
MEGEEEYFFQCPYCFSSVSMIFETFYGKQEYIEDCEVCCRPITINYSIDDGKVTSFNALRLDD